MSGRRYLALLALLAASWPRAARADGDDLAALLDESVVTAPSSTSETGRDAPATTTVITGEDLHKYGARTLAEAMDILALGTMSASGPDGTEMGARGVLQAHSGAAHFLLLLNGQRANDPLNGAVAFGRDSGIPLEIVDHIEVILGPGSVLYGSNAMAGVVNVVTKDAKGFSGVHVGVEAGVFKSVRPWAGFGAPFKLFGSDGSASAEVEYFQQWGPSLYYAPVYGGNDPATGKPFRYTSAPQGTGVWGGASASNPSRIDAPSLLGRVRLGKFELGLNAAMAWTPIGSAEADFDSPTRQRTRRLLLNLAYEDQLTAVVKVKAHGYFNAADSESSIFMSRSPDCPVIGATCIIDVLGAGQVRGIEATPSFDWFKNGSFVTLVGTDVALRSGRSLVNETNAANGLPVTVSTGIFDRTDVGVGAYLQQTWDPVEWFGLNAGARLDYDPRFSPVASPRLALRVEPWQGGTFKAIYSEAFRAPSFFESYFSHPLAPAAPGLLPERERSVEASLEQRFGAQRVFFGVFSSYWTDLIQYYQFSPQEAAAYVAAGKSALPPAYQYRNLSSVRNWGLNGAFQGTQLSRTLEYGVNLTAAIAREEDSDGVTPLPVSPRLFGNVHVAYHLPGAWPTIAFAASVQGTRAVENAFSSGFSPTPYVPAVAVLHGTLTGPIPAVRGLSYRVTGSYATVDHEPFLAGPAVGPSSSNPSPALMPIDQTRVTVGLQYEFQP